MRKWIRVILITLLLAGGATVCVIRWQAWFGMPDEPVWTGDTLDYVFPCPINNQQSKIRNDFSDFGGHP